MSAIKADDNNLCQILLLGLLTKLKPACYIDIKIEDVKTIFCKSFFFSKQNDLDVVNFIYTDFVLSFFYNLSKDRKKRNLILHCVLKKHSR